jgi:hypothetical protein
MKDCGESEFKLPDVILRLVEAHQAVVKHYEASRRTFTLDGKLIGDIGEAVACELFDIELSASNDHGIDAYAKDGRSVQIKATATSGNPMFRPVEKRADHLIFLGLDLKSASQEFFTMDRSTSSSATCPRTGRTSGRLASALFEKREKTSPRRASCRAEKSDPIPALLGTRHELKIDPSRRARVDSLC